MTIVEKIQAAEEKEISEAEAGKEKKTRFVTNSREARTLLENIAKLIYAEETEGSNVFVYNPCHKEISEEWYLEYTLTNKSPEDIGSGRLEVIMQARKIRDLGLMVGIGRINAEKASFNMVQRFVKRYKSIVNYLKQNNLVYDGQDQEGWEIYKEK